jgi:iron(III) transport system permease protein
MTGPKRIKQVVITAWFGFAALFILYPVFMVVGTSLFSDGRASLENLISILTLPHLNKLIFGTIAVSLGSATIATFLGLVIALTVFKTRLPFRKLFGAAAVTPMILPGFVTCLAYIFLFGRNGLITYQWLDISWDTYSWKSVLILQSFGFTTTSFFLITASVMDFDSRVEDAARNLGASEWHILTRIVLPIIRPGVVSAWLLIFLRAMADFSTPYIVGGRFNTLASASYTQLIGVFNTGIAAALNTVLLILCLSAYWGYTRVQRRMEKTRTTQTEITRKPLALNAFVNSVLFFICSGFTIVVLSFLISVILAAFTRHLGGDFTLTMDHFKILPRHGWNSAVNTVMFAGGTSFLMAFLSLWAAYLITRFKSRTTAVLDGILTLPFAVPGTFIGLGYALAFNREPLLLTGTWAIIIVCTLVRELPLGLRAGINILLRQDRSIEQASASLGAGRVTTFTKIVVPMARPALMISACYAFVATVKTLGAIIFIMSPGRKVLAADIFEATVRGDTGNAAALSFLVMLVASGGLLSIIALSKKNGVMTWFQRIPGRLS